MKLLQILQVLPLFLIKHTDIIFYIALIETFGIGRLVHSLGLISNGAILKRVLPTDIYSHSITTDGMIRTINFRVLMSERAVNHSQIQVFLNNHRLQSSDKSQSEPGSNLKLTAQDYNGQLINGLNSFEVSKLIILIHPFMNRFLLQHQKVLMDLS